MLGQQLGGQGVVLLEHNVQHRPGVIATRTALAVSVHGPQVSTVLLALQTHRAGGDQRDAEAGRARGENTVEPARAIEDLSVSACMAAWLRTERTESDGRVICA